MARVKMPALNSIIEYPIAFTYFLMQIPEQSRSREVKAAG
uniref:Uncharacterized protein n=1 Tax=Arundo donax TaxID=35708 RepID=A0A0A9GP77_ARUDO